MSKGLLSIFYAVQLNLRCSRKSLAILFALEVAIVIPTLLFQTQDAKIFNLRLSTADVFFHLAKGSVTNFPITWFCLALGVCLFCSNILAPLPDSFCQFILLHLKSKRRYIVTLVLSTFIKLVVALVALILLVLGGSVLLGFPASPDLYSPVYTFFSSTQPDQTLIMWINLQELLVLVFLGLFSLTLLLDGIALYLGKSIAVLLFSAFTLVHLLGFAQLHTLHLMMAVAYVEGSYLRFSPIIGISIYLCTCIVLITLLFALSHIFPFSINRKREVS